jgi:hypothetical protein
LWSESRRTHDHILLSHLRLPQPGGPGPRIYIPQEQRGPVIPTDTGFPFRRLLLLARLRWRYCSPPPHGQSNYSAFANSHIQQFNTARTKPSRSAVFAPIQFLCSYYKATIPFLQFACRCLATAIYNCLSTSLTSNRFICSIIFFVNPLLFASCTDTVKLLEA